MINPKIKQKVIENVAGLKYLLECGMSSHYYDEIEIAMDKVKEIVEKLIKEKLEGALA